MDTYIHMYIRIGGHIQDSTQIDVHYMWQSQVENEHYSTLSSVSLYECLNSMHSKFQSHSYWQSLVIAITPPTLMFVFYL